MPPIGSDAAGFRLTQPPRFSDPSVPPPPPPTSSYAPPGAGPFQRFPTPQFPSTAPPPPPRGPPVGPPPVQSQSGYVSTPPVSFRPQPPPVAMGSPPQRTNFAPAGVNAPQPLVDSSFSAPRPSSQPPFASMDQAYAAAKSTMPPSMPGFGNVMPNAATQAPIAPSPFPAQPGSYMPPPPTSASPFHGHQGGYAPPLTTAPAPPPGLAAQHSGPPVGVMQGLAEDFNSLSLGSLPGSIEPGVDWKTLPRPLEGDEEPNSLAEMFPLNCHSRYLRLTTTAIPNSSSLVSRWHLPLGAVVCPLAETPEGVSVSH